MEIKTHWWMALPAIPLTAEDEAYKRLRKIWSDKTRFRGIGKSRKHEFVTHEWETHLTATLWENFTLFEPMDWLSELSAAAAIQINHDKTRSCNWSYGFREKATKKIADIAIGFDGLDEGLGCYVIEAKRPGAGKLTDKDLDPSYYLDIEHISANANIKKLIYCVDMKDKNTLISLFSKQPKKFKDCGAVTWEEIAGIQIRLAKKIDASPKIRSFVSGSIQYQFCQHGIVPTMLSEDYLTQEPSIAQVDEKAVARYDNHDPQWARV